MAMVVKNNMSAISTLNTLNGNTTALQRSLAKVSSGMKINTAQDDASGYAISERMRVMISSLDQANQNTQNGSSLMKVAEGAVSNTVEILKTLKQKAIDAATDTNTDDDRATIQKEIDQFVDQIDDNALVTFNGKYLLDGSKTPSGKATYGSMTNEALSTETTALTKLTDLYARNGEHLIIESTDKVTASYVQGGRTYVTTFQVGDNTLGDVFRNVENIDQSSKIFATSDNEDVAKAGNIITSSADKTAVDKAVAYLQDALSLKNLGASASEGEGEGGGEGEGEGGASSGVSATEDKFIKVTYGDDGVAAFSLEDNLASPSPFTSALTKADGVSNSYNGEIGQKVQDAYTTYNSITTSIDSRGEALATQLTSEFGSDEVDWNSSLGTIYEIKQRIYEEGSDRLIQYYEEYTDATASQIEARKALDDALYEYNSGMAQLDALTKLKDFEAAKVSYKTAVDAYISAARTEMSGKTDGIYTLPAGIGTNIKALIFNAGDTTLTEAERSKAIDNILTALNDKLYTLVDSLTIPVSGFATTVTGLVDSSATGFKYNDGENDVDVAATAKATLIGTSGAEGVDTAGASGIFDNATLRYLELARNDALAQYSGPTLLTGSNIGVDATNHLVTTPDGKAGLTITAANSGLDGQIAGFSISISDAEGNVRKSVDTILNSWTVLNFARNESVEDNALKIHIGAAASQSISVGLADMRAHALGLKGNDGKVVDVSTQANANAAVAVFNNALQKALDQQTTIGAIEARLEYTASNLTVSSENVQAAESVIRDADMAKEMTNYTKNNVLLQAAQSMLAQANQNSSAVLSLLQ